MFVPIDIETIPGPLATREADIAAIAEAGNFKPNLKKAELIEALGGGSQLKYKTVDELIPMWVEENKDQAAEETYRKRSLDGSYGNVFSYAFEFEGEMFSFGLDDGCMNESYLLNQLIEDLRECLSRQDGGLYDFKFVVHNATFDLKFLFRRMVINSINTHKVKFPFQGYHGKDYFCTMFAWCGREGKIKQDELCKILGIEGKPGDINGSNVYDHAVRGDYARILEYNIDDVKKLSQIFDRLYV